MPQSKVQSDVHESMSSLRIYVKLPRTVSNKTSTAYVTGSKVNLNVKVAHNSGAKRHGELA